MTAINLARSQGGSFLLRIEDLDPARCRPEYEQAIYDDLGWLGISWDEPVVRQSERATVYAKALARLDVQGLIYPCRCTRGDIQAALAAPQEGADRPVAYPGTCRSRSMAEAGPEDAIRLDLGKALGGLENLDFTEEGSLHPGTHTIDFPQLLAEEGDIVLQRRDTGLAAYHLAVVVDDAAQGITHVVRGDDLFGATRIQLVLQARLGLPVPRYHHHDLIRDDQGKRLAKRDDARAIRRYREDGLSPADVRRMVGL